MRAGEAQRGKRRNGAEDAWVAPEEGESAPSDSAPRAFPSAHSARFVNSRL